MDRVISWECLVVHFWNGLPPREVIFDLIRYDELQLMETTFPGTNGKDRKLSMATVNKLMDLRTWFVQQDNHTPSVFLALRAALPVHTAFREYMGVFSRSPTKDLGTTR